MYDSPLNVIGVLAVASIAFELLGAFSHHRSIIRIGYGGSVVPTSFTMTLLALWYPSIITLTLFLVGIFRLVNVARALAGRMHERHVAVVARRTTVVLGLMYSVLLVAVLQDFGSAFTTPAWLTVLLLAGLIGSIVAALSARHSLSHTSVRLSDSYKADASLPTVSVCIPARNESDYLPACLESILKSDYPKLEILVLDDCSHDQTSEIIRDFAQKGVRFIKGEPPHKSWLAKNQAYKALAEAASGDFILFCGVDVRLGPHAIRRLVAVMLHRKKSMISVLPQGEQGKYDASLVQPMRYWWELALPRKLFNRPPVLSTLWMINKSELLDLGSFSAVSNTVVPEAYFARSLARRKDSYSFLRSQGDLQVTSVKRLAEQIETAVRLRYPQLRKRPEMVLAILLLESIVLLAPTLVFVSGFFFAMGWVWLLAGITQLVLAYTHIRITKAWDSGQASLLLATFPLAVLSEMYLVILSMYRYEFSEVRWKGRNICIPVMHVYRHLPKA